MKKIISFVFVCFLCFQVSAHADFFNDDPGSFLYRDNWNYYSDSSKVSLTDVNNRLEATATGPSLVSEAQFFSKSKINFTSSFHSQIDFTSEFFTTASKGATLGFEFSNNKNTTYSFEAISANQDYFGLRKWTTATNWTVESVVAPYQVDVFSGTLYVDYLAPTRELNFYALQENTDALLPEFQQVDVTSFIVPEAVINDDYTVAFKFRAGIGLNTGAYDSYLENFQMNPTAAPEPLSATLFLLGGAGLVVARRRKK